MTAITVRTISRVLILCLCFLTAPSASLAEDPVCGPERVDLIDQMLTYLGFKSTHRHALVNEGEIIHTALPDLERLPEDLAVAGVMLIVRSPMSEVVEVFLDDETFRQGHEVATHGAIPEHASTAQLEDTFSRVEFSDSEKKEVHRLLTAEPGPHFNLSREEYSRLAGINPRDAAASEQASKIYRDIMIDRFQALHDQGFDGIEPYARKRQKTSRPDRELMSAFDGMEYLSRHFPEFIAALRVAPQPHTAEVDHEDFWIKKHLDDRPLFVLSHRILILRDNFALASDMQYFVGHSYNSMLTTIAAMKCQENTLIVAVNHTFTDQVTGVGAGIKKKVGRSRIVEELAQHFGALRNSIESRN